MYPSLSSCANLLRPQLFFLLLIALLASPIHAQTQASPNEDVKGHKVESSAWIVIDGRKLFEVRGVKSYPATERVANVRQKIIATAKDKTLSIDDINTVETDDRTIINAGNTQLIAVFDPDGEFDGINRQLLATIYMEKIKRAITEYRRERSRPVLLENTSYALGATLVMALLMWATLHLTRWLHGLAERHIQRNLESLANKSHQLIRAAQVWTLFAGLLRALRFLSIALLVYFYLNGVLGLYPWTRPAALVLFDLILNPLKSLGQGFLAAIPNLMFLVILFLVVRYIIRLVRLFFEGVEHGRIRLQNFDRDWSLPTFKILRILIIAFSLVIAYPYIPGSQSMAFKGISLFLGVIVSLGSSSFIANMMAGLSMTYRGAFKEGERIKIGDVVGTVDEIKLMITRIRTHKNEIVVIPNSNILNTNVVNYSMLARKHGLVLHTVVGIGYDAPWRQVEAMLVQAADRTKGLKTEPKPYVLQLSLGDFAVNYELNAYCGDETRMLAMYSDLHANIQDVFNENGVQIMSPAYEADPATPKLVPPDKWYAEPATRPES